MYLGSTAKSLGALVLDYDFARAFPLTELGNAPGTWIGVDPSFTSPSADDPARSLYRLKDGAKVTLEIVSIDANTAAGLLNRTLDTVGDRATVGTMPYLHVHPQWKITLPPGALGNGHISFRLRSSAYDPSPIYSATLSATPPATTSTTTSTTTTQSGPTSSTVEGTSTTSTTSSTTVPVCTTGTCNDDDPCTNDFCDGTACMHAPSSDADEALCRVDAIRSTLDRVTPTARAARRLLARVLRATTRAHAVLQSLRTKPGPRRFAVATRRLDRLSALIDVAEHAALLTPGGLSDLRRLATSAYDALARWQQTQP